ncbi:unnamed protein product [Calicophoron daubneyi]
MGDVETVTVNSSAPKYSEYTSDNWLLSIKESHILRSGGQERKDFEDKLDLPSLPEMIFDVNEVRVVYTSENMTESSTICFNALDALKLVDCTKIPMELPFAKDWKESRSDLEGEVVDKPKPYDWTFTTSFTGTLSGPWTVSDSTGGLDMELLRRRDPILFYADTTLYEDELGDNGISMLNVKVRAMKTGFFLLQRFFLRVDGGLVRTYDTRIQWRKGDE